MNLVSNIKLEATKTAMMALKLELTYLLYYLRKFSSPK